MRGPILTAVAVVFVLLGCAGGKTSDAEATLDAFLEAYNAEDLEGVLALFSEDSLMVGHPAGGFATSLDDIRSEFSEDVGLGATASVSNVRVEERASGEADGAEALSAVTWDQTWTFEVDGETDELCWSGHSALISDGTILSLNWSRFDCP